MPRMWPASVYTPTGSSSTVTLPFIALVKSTSYEVGAFMAFES
jgi:hypothetical protein